METTQNTSDLENPINNISDKLGDGINGLKNKMGNIKNVLQNIKNKFSTENIKNKLRNVTTGFIVKIFLALTIILVIYKIYKYLVMYNSPVLINKIKDAKKHQIILEKQLPKSRNGIEYSYSFWINIDDWNYKHGKIKNILSRGNDLSVDFHPSKNNLIIKINDNTKKYRYIKEKSTGTYSGNPKTVHLNANLDSCMERCNEESKCGGISHSSDVSRNIINAPSSYPKIFDFCSLYQKTNSVDHYDDDDTKKYFLNLTNSYKKTNIKNLKNTDSCNLKNIPLQKWIHVCISLWNRTVDVYIDGELRRSCILDSIPKLESGNLHVNKNGGYSGYISDLRYYPYPLSGNKIQDLYSSGKKSLNLFHKISELAKTVNKTNFV